MRQALYVQRVALSDPRREAIEFTCLIARAIAAPLTVIPMEWRLWSNRRAETLAAVAEWIEWSRAHYKIALLFVVLKEGCRVKSLQLVTLDGCRRFPDCSCYAAS